MESTIKFKRSNGKANLRKRMPTLSTTSSSDSDDDTKPRGSHAKRLKTNPSAQESAKTSSQDVFPNLFAADGPVPITNNNDAANSARAVRPVKGPTNIRTTVTTDFSPDICKDYKQTGFCGFGDNCKFAHIREDYKQGWQLEREWEDVTRGKKKVSSTAVARIDGKEVKEEEDGDEETFPGSTLLTCIICKATCKKPIVAKCGHYFCQSCALKRYRKDPTCATCGADTNGVFNSAKRLEKLLEMMREFTSKRQLAGTSPRRGQRRE